METNSITRKKEIKMQNLQIIPVSKTVFRVLMSTKESDVFYVAKKRNTWVIANQGQIIDFAPNKSMAIASAINHWKV